MLKISCQKSSEHTKILNFLKTAVCRCFSILHVFDMDWIALNKRDISLTSVLLRLSRTVAPEDETVKLHMHCGSTTGEFPVMTIKD